MAGADERELTACVDRVLNRWPTAGLAVGVVRRGAPDWCYGYGVADVDAGTPVDEGTVFRVASVTKTVTAIAVMQLWEQGLVDLDAPVAEYLRGFALVPARAGWRPATLRLLLTHTAGVRAVRGPLDLVRPTLGWGAAAGRPAPPLPEYYRGRLRVDTEPGSRWAYSNHAFAAVGQAVEDVSGVPFDRYVRERIFDPLGMTSSDLVRSGRVRARIAAGYELRSRGLRRPVDREIVTTGASSVYSCVRDMARYVAALLGGGANDHGSVLRPETLAAMFEPHYQPDPRVPGMGLAFFRGEVAGHRTVGHDGIWKGFLSDLEVAPDDGVGVVVLGNTGGFDRRGAPVPVADAVLRRLLDVPDDAVPGGVPQRPWTWRDLCGWYSFGPGVLTDPQPRTVLGPGLEVVARRDGLVLRGQMPVPAVRRGVRLHPDGADPDLFRVDLSPLGLGTSPVVFTRGSAGEVTALCLGLVPLLLRKRPEARNPRRWADGALAAVAASSVLARRVHTRRAGRSRSEGVRS